MAIDRRQIIAECWTCFDGGVKCTGCVGKPHPKHIHRRGFRNDHESAKCRAAGHDVRPVGSADNIEAAYQAAEADRNREIAYARKVRPVAQKGEGS